MLYNPAHFKVSSSPLIAEITEHYNFATLITIQDALPVISHLPLLYKPEHSTIHGHMARANPQWRTFGPKQEALAMFQGPHAYISPSWYQPQTGNVPTWNYAVVHIQGIPKVIHDENLAYEKMMELVHSHDPDWQLTLPDQERREMMREIVVFEIAVTRLEAKFKMSQNKSGVDAEGVAEQLSRSDDPIERQVGALMRRLRNADQV